MKRALRAGIFGVWVLAGCAQAVSTETSDASGGTTSGAGGHGGESATTVGAGGGLLTGGGAPPSVCVPGEMKSCYDGPPGTQGVGPCKAGAIVCAADGSGFGPCTGQIVPTAEICGDAIDQDCSGKVNDGCSCVPGTTQACYSGPPGSQNIGVCKSGTTTCLADGSGYGPCVGEVDPGAEVCGNALDDDCDGAVNESEAGCNPSECAGCVASLAPACGSSAVVVGHYEGGGKTICIAQGDGSTFDLALMSYDPTSWSLTGAVNRINKIQIYSFDPGTTIQGNGAIPTSLQTGGSVPANPYSYAMSMGDCPAHTGYAGAVFGVPQADVCHMEAGLPDACSYPGYACLSISP